MIYSVKLNGKQYEVEVEKVVDDFRAMTRAEISGDVVFTEKAQPARTEMHPASSKPVKTETQSAPTPAAETGTGVCTVLCPMPGKVLGVKAAVGQRVCAGDVLVVVEAMKMENEIVAPQDGVVESLPVKEGDSLETDAVLAVLK